MWTIILLIVLAIVYMIIPKKGEGLKLGKKKDNNGSTPSNA